MKKPFANTHADKTTETKSNAVANGFAAKQSGEQETFQFEDNRHEVITQREIKEAASNSEQIKQLKALQAIANNSPQVRQQRAVQAMINNHSAQKVLQKKDLEKEGLLWKKTEPFQNWLEFTPQKGPQPLTNQNLQSNKIIQRIIIQGSDADESGEYATLGFSRLVSQSEIQNTNEFMKAEKRDGDKKIYNISELVTAKVEYDAMNYINGHYEASKEQYLGYDPKGMAILLVKSGLKTGNNITLLGCEGAGFARALVIGLKGAGAAVKVTGATGIAFDYEDTDGSIVEAMYDSSKIPYAVNKKHNIDNKLAIAHKYEEIFINRITPVIMQAGDLRQQTQFYDAFKFISRVKFQPTSTLSAVQKIALETAQRLFSSKIGGAPKDNDKAAEKEERELTAEIIIADSQRDPFPNYSKSQLITFNNKIRELNPGPRGVGKDVYDLNLQAKNGTFLLEYYTSPDQLWIRDFMKKTKSLEEGDLKQYILDTYVAEGRNAANEYIRTMCEGYNEDAKAAILTKGWITFNPDETTAEYATFRQAADAK